MIITRVKVENWRSIESTELHLQPGLNILGGDNEEGKSSLVEAIQKALCWDSTARKTSADKLDYLVPVGKPTARPTVELELKFAGLTATLTKVVAESKQHRQCHLVMHQNGRQTVWKDTDAEIKLGELLAGYRDAGPLRWSEQGKAFDYLLQSLPSAACTALSVADNGTIVPSHHLELVRQAIMTERNRQLRKNLKFPLRESALAGTEACRLREDLTKKAEALDKARSELAAVEELRRNLLALDREIHALQPQMQSAGEYLKKLREKRHYQDQVEKDLLTKQQTVAQLQVDLKKLEKQSEDMIRLRQSIEVHHSTCRNLEEQLKQHKRARAEAGTKEDAASRSKASAEVLLEEAQRRRDAIICRRELLEQAAQLLHARQDQKKLADLQRHLDQAEQTFRELGIWPTGLQIGGWRRWHNELIALQTEALNKLHVELALVRPCRIEWSADGDLRPSLLAQQEQPSVFKAIRSLRLSIDDVGTIQVRCGAEELAILLDKIDKQTKKIDNAICGFGIRANDLPDGFDRLEELRIAGENGQRLVEAARQKVAECEAELGTLSETQKAVAQHEYLFAGCKARFEPLKDLIPDDLDGNELAQELEKQQETVAACEKERKAWEHKLHGCSEDVKNHVIAIVTCSAQLGQERSKGKDATKQLDDLLADGLTPEQREQTISRLRLEVGKATEAAMKVEEVFAKLGVPVGNEELTNLEQNLFGLDTAIQQKRQELAGKRSELRMRCGSDPQGQIDELAEEIRDLEVKLATEEIKLSGLVLLEGLLAVERQRLSQLISEPLNNRIGPWLTQIRGLPTKVLLDESEGSIAWVTTERAGREEQLPFGELSAGLKGQIAFLIRLTLASVMAQQRGDREFVLLDDPLTETSPRRRPEMLRILHHASQDLQILFITCHEDAFVAIPGPVHWLSLNRCVTPSSRGKPGALGRDGLIPAAHIRAALK